MTKGQTQFQSAEEVAAHVVREEKTAVLYHTPRTTLILLGKFMLDRPRPASPKPEVHKQAATESRTVLELSREEIVRRIEQGAQQRRRMSARDLIRAYRTGNLRDPGAVGDLLALADLLPEDDELFAES